MENQEMDQNYIFDEEKVEVVSETRASSKLRSNLKRKKIMRVSVYESLFIAATTLAKTPSSSAETVESIASSVDSEDKHFMTFEEAHNKTMGSIIRQANEALEESEKAMEEDPSMQTTPNNRVTFQNREDAKDELMKRGVSEAENRALDAISTEIPLPKVTPENEKRKESDRMNENTPVQEQDSYKGTFEMYDNSEYWKLTGQTFRRGPSSDSYPQDKGTRIWIQTGEEWEKVGEALILSPVWAEFVFDFDKVIDKVNYEQLANTVSFSENGGPNIKFPAIYGSADRAVLKQEPVPSQYTVNFVGAKVGMPYILKDGISVRVDRAENLNDLDPFAMSFPLVREDENGTKQIIGFVNVVEAMDNLSSYMLETYAKEFSL